ncbi:MAG: hypothetical protein LBI95_03290 [Holosporales bacterium]|jgi:hypothetical protein|nr:hypothetical protein [Holosporales bacterium]
MFFKNDKLLKKFFLIALCAIAFYSFQKAFGSTNGNAEESMKKKVVTEFVTGLADYLIGKYQKRNERVSGDSEKKKWFNKGNLWGNMNEGFIKELQKIKDNISKTTADGSISTLKDFIHNRFDVIGSSTVELEKNILKKDKEIKGLKEQLKKSKNKKGPWRKSNSQNEAPLSRSKIKLRIRLKELKKKLKNITSTRKSEIEKLQKNNTALKRVNGKVTTILTGNNGQEGN